MTMVDQNAPERDARYGGKVNIFVRYRSTDGETMYKGVEYDKPTNGEELYGYKHSWPAAVFSFSDEFLKKHEYLPTLARLRVPLRDEYKGSNGKPLTTAKVVDQARTAFYRRIKREKEKAPTGQAGGGEGMQWELPPLQAEAPPAEGASTNEEMESLMVVELLENIDVDAEPSPTGEVAADEMAADDMVPSADSSTIPGDAQGSSDADQSGIGQEERSFAETITQTQEQNAAETTALMEEGTERLRRVAANAAAVLAEGLLLVALRSPRANALEVCDWLYKEESFLKKVEKQWGAKLTEEQKKLCQPIFKNADINLRNSIRRRTAEPFRKRQ